MSFTFKLSLLRLFSFSRQESTQRASQKWSNKFDELMPPSPPLKLLCRDRNRERVHSIINISLAMNISSEAAAETFIKWNFQEDDFHMWVCVKWMKFVWCASKHSHIIQLLSSYFYLENLKTLCYTQRRRYKWIVSGPVFFFEQNCKSNLYTEHRT